MLMVVGCGGGSFTARANAAHRTKTNKFCIAPTQADVAFINIFVQGGSRANTLERYATCIDVVSPL